MGEIWARYGRDIGERLTRTTAAVFRSSTMPIAGRAICLALISRSNARAADAFASPWKSSSTMHQ